MALIASRVFGSGFVACFVWFDVACCWLGYNDLGVTCIVCDFAVLGVLVYAAEVRCRFCVVAFDYYDSWFLCYGCICVVLVGSNVIAVVFVFGCFLCGGLFGFGCLAYELLVVLIVVC